MLKFLERDILFGSKEDIDTKSNNYESQLVLISHQHFFTLDVPYTCGENKVKHMNERGAKLVIFGIFLH